MDDNRIRVQPDEARQGEPRGVVRHILWISLALVIIAFAIVYKLAF